jgi:type II secretory pathway predicted ATPase ExeA
MYIDFFKLREFPFRLTPDTEFLYMSSGHARAKAYMDYTVWNREGFVVITGEIGSGKTTLIKRLLSELDENVLVAKIFQTQLNEVEFLQAVLVEFGMNPFRAQKVELIDMLNTFLVDNFHNGKQLALVVDDAHNLSPTVLEEIRMLSGLETRKEKVLHVILVGQPQLDEILAAPEMEQLLQRVRLRYHIKALSEDDTKEYKLHRLHIAGASDPELFMPATFPVIYKYTGGVPRLINTLCDTCLICAYAENTNRVSPQVLSAAIEELQWVPYAKRANRRRTMPSPSTYVEANQHLQDHARALVGMTDHLAKLSTLLSSLPTISVRLAKIETVLGDISALLHRESREPESLKKKA